MHARGARAAIRSLKTSNRLKATMQFLHMYHFPGCVLSALSLVADLEVKHNAYGNVWQLCENSRFLCRAPL